MKTFKKSFLPDSIEHKGLTFKMNSEESSKLSQGTATEASIKNWLAACDQVCVKVVVTNPRLKGKTDIHGKPYPSSTWIFSAPKSPATDTTIADHMEKREREKDAEDIIDMAVTHPTEAGQTVGFIECLEEGDAEARFKVLEMRGDRVLVQDILSTMPLASTHVYRVAEMKVIS